MIRVLVVDDEELSRERIISFLKDEKDFIIAGECSSGTEALEKIKSLMPDLVFLDIQMPGMNGIDVLQNIDAPLPQIIFVTAYDEYAIKAFELNAADYLLKPFSKERFIKTIDKVKQNLSSTGLNEKVLGLISDLQKKEKFLSRFIVKSSQTFTFVPVDEVNYIEAEGNYIKIKTQNGSHLVRDTITRTCARLNPADFVRVHRSLIVNVNKIKQMQTHFNGEYIIVLKDNTKLRTGRNYKEAVEKILLSE